MSEVVARLLLLVRAANVSCVLTMCQARCKNYVICIFSFNLPHISRRQVLIVSITLQMRKLRPS